MTAAPAKLTRKAQKAQTRAAVRAAAQRLFEARGYRDVQVSEIAAAAGVAAGTVYVHYPSKDALIDELLAEFNAGLVARLLPLWQAPGARDDWRATVAATAAEFLGYWQAHRGFVAAYAEKVAAGLSLEALRDGINPEAEAALLPVVEALAAQSGAPLPAPRLVVQGLLALWLRVGLQVLFQDDLNTATGADLLARMTVGVLEGVLA